MRIKLSRNAIMPTRAHPWDAGLDLYARYDGFIRCNSHRTFDTGVHVEIPEVYVGYIKSKSGLMVNHGITTDGTIDSHYTGPIKVCLVNHGGSKYEVKAGDTLLKKDGIIHGCVALEGGVMLDFFSPMREDFVK